MNIPFPSARLAVALGGLVVFTLASVRGQTNASYQVFVTNEKSGNLTVIDGATLQVSATVPVGKRPRGVHASPDGKTLYVAVSGTPIEPPPKIDANGNLVFEKARDDDDDKVVETLLTLLNG